MPLYAQLCRRRSVPNVVLDLFLALVALILLRFLGYVCTIHTRYHCHVLWKTTINLDWVLSGTSGTHGSLSHYGGKTGQVDGYGFKDRGSFPLDHYGECKDYMKAYLDCLRKEGSNSSPCRPLNRDYLDCRMNKGLMDRDDWKNLGLSNLAGDPPQGESPNNSSKSNDSPQKAS